MAGNRFQPMPNTSEVLQVVVETLTHMPTLGHAGDDLLVRLLGADMRYNWWYLQGKRRSREEFERDPHAAFLDDMDLSIEYAELIEAFLGCWRSWRAGEVSAGRVIEVLRATVLDIEEKLRNVPNPPWE
ncbi:hypothetical protein [Streptomyces orinoci]|uniref:Uncharacterized protein n=1 Tax=Streptomyces orinoci TaxID=67339 RepID=A0ABV3K871_STRON|nr:hypothetical protein [Streptomyces orinoci]